MPKPTQAANLAFNPSLSNFADSSTSAARDGLEKRRLTFSLSESLVTAAKSKRSTRTITMEGCRLSISPEVGIYSIFSALGRLGSEKKFLKGLASDDGPFFVFIMSCTGTVTTNKEDTDDRCLSQASGERVGRDTRKDVVEVGGNHPMFSIILIQAS
ncbi:uncharacterized protein BDCG_04845 [Blastomyces dermatitidis ER-3]|nr:uncharacterized protein BDCG_04845 [Blastomyces dermatitidis ER-3]EEQ89725.1 hypothetical protein BDCG_04845 [Blastomyces dermatitidis ER-3]EGE85950.2 hypothetical protein BDDG_08895 [Blastomyces dermatitidis ATCC 18188]